MNKAEVATLMIESLSPVVDMGMWLIGLVLTAFAAAIIWAWKLSSLFTKHGYDMSGLKSDISGLKNDISDLKKFASNVDKKLAHIDSHLVKLDIHDDRTPYYASFSAYTQASSPLTLTPEGEGLVKDSGFLDAIYENKGIFDGIIANAKGRPDLEAFVEKAAFEKVESLFNEDNVIIAKVAQFMYENGMRQSNLVYNAAIRAFSVAARDMIFKEMGVVPPVPKQNRNI